MGARKTERNEQYEYVVAAKPSNTQKHSAFEHTHTQVTDNKRKTKTVREKRSEKNNRK